MKIGIDIVPSGYFFTTPGMIGLPESHVREILHIPAQVACAGITDIVYARVNEEAVSQLVDAMKRGVLSLRDAQPAGKC